MAKTQNMGDNSVVTQKLNKVEHDKTNEQNAKEKEEIMKVVSRAAYQISKEVVNSTVRKTVNCAEMKRKYPPVSDTIQKLMEPKKSTYIALYNKFGDVLHPTTVGAVKEKIDDYLKATEEKIKEQKLVEDKQLEKRKKRKDKAKAIQEANAYKNFCSEQCDEIFEIFLDKFTKCNNRGIPTPLTMGMNSKNLYDNIQAQLMKIIGQGGKTSSSPSSSTTTEEVGKSQLAAQGGVIQPTSQGGGANSANAVQSNTASGIVQPTPQDGGANIASAQVAVQSNTQGGVIQHSSEDVGASAANSQVVVQSSSNITVGQSTAEGNDETMETLETLSYFIFEFVKNLLIESVKMKIK